MEFPIIEIVDRYAIAVVKYDETNGANRDELEFYTAQLNDIGLDPLDAKLIELIEHHRYVWSLENDFKKAKIDCLPLEEIGRRALHIRDIGYKRQELKNVLADIADKDSVREIKKYQ